MRTLLIDNYDSFTYNLFQFLAEVNGAEPEVVANDAAGWSELSRREFEAVVVSPGPGRPERERDFGICAEAIRECRAPLLGVCLGHQGIGWAHGGRVERAPRAVHGRTSAIEHSGSPLFAGIPKRFAAVRYHSLCLEHPLPAELEEIAWTEDRVPMALAHRSRPQWGVQFHPESIATEHGRRLLVNFRDLALAHSAGRPPARVPSPPIRAAANPVATAASRLEVKVRRLDLLPDSERVFAELFGDSRDAFWLDSSRDGARARFSFMGDAGGPHGASVSYDVGAGEVRVDRGGRVERRRESIFDYLDSELARPAPATEELPFDFDCGFAGYLGYELKADCGGRLAHSSPLPDAALVFADRLLAFDHRAGQTYLLCLTARGDEVEAERWIGATAERLRTISSTTVEPAAEAVDLGHPEPQFRLERRRERYLEDISVCEERLLEGESYEVCLTNALETEIDDPPLDVYRRLRRLNPAPFAAYLRFGGLAVLSSSPERFLSVDRERGVEARPIKGTCRRGADPIEDARLAAGLAESEKDRAENLMIADLLRNDLGSVCEVGSVQVPALMEVEAYETVHQLVSTVRGRLRQDLGAADCIRACFPPGSMTGAPKLRTMEILDRLEGAPRGVYSGAIGYLGLGGGCDLSVAIRTIVLDRGRARIGAGGAIVLGSDAEEEYEEMLLKAAAPMRAIDPRAGILQPRRAIAKAVAGRSAHDPTS